MKLWLLRPNPDLPNDTSDPWHWKYDMNHGFVIRAKSEERARQMANDIAGDENMHSQVWLDPNYSSCTELTSKGPEVIIMKDQLSG